MYRVSGDDAGNGIGNRDLQTVTADGSSTAPVIEGVRTKRVIVHGDHRGRVFEVVNHHEYWTEPIVHTYVFTVRPGLVKGWGVHDVKSDRYLLIAGELLMLLWDGRDGSATQGVVQEVMLTGEGVRMLTIPPGVWHANINVGPDECVLMNHPTKAYDYENPDRRTLPWDSSAIPVNLSIYFPTQWGGG